jgi:hypothetical protein
LQPTKFEFLINLKTFAGLTTPPDVLAIANEAIDLSMVFAALHMSPLGTKRPKATATACPQLAKADVKQRILVLRPIPDKAIHPCNDEVTMFERVREMW